MLKQATDQCINGLHNESQTSLAEYHQIVGAMTLMDNFEHCQKMHEQKTDQIGKLEEYIQILPQQPPTTFSGRPKLFTERIIKLWNESAGIIELSYKIGKQFFGILVLADSDPVAAFKKLNAEFLTPESVEDSLNANGLEIDNGFLLDFRFAKAKEELVKQFNEFTDPKFKTQIEDCVKRIYKNPDLLRKFDAILTYCHRKLRFEGSRPVIFKDWPELKHLSKNPDNLSILPCAEGLAQLTEDFLNRLDVCANLDSVRAYEENLTFEQRLEYYRQISEERHRYIRKLRELYSPEAQQLVNEWAQVCGPKGFLLHTILYQPDEAFKELTDRLFSTPEATADFIKQYTTEFESSQYVAYMEIKELLDSKVGIKVQNEFVTRFANKRKDQDEMAHDEIVSYLLRNV